MAGYIGIAYGDMNVGETVGHYGTTVSKKDIETYFKNAGTTFHQNIDGERLFVPPPMAYALTLRAIFHSNIPVDGPILVGHELKCIEKVFEGDGIDVDVIIKDKWIKKDRKYIIFDFIVKNTKKDVCFIDSMRVIWPE